MTVERRRQAVPGRVRMADRQLRELRQAGTAYKAYSTRLAEVERYASPRVVRYLKELRAAWGGRFPTDDDDDPNPAAEAADAALYAGGPLSEEESLDLMMALSGDQPLTPTQALSIGRSPAWRHVLPADHPPIIGEDERGWAIFEPLPGYRVAPCYRHLVEGDKSRGPARPAPEPRQSPKVSAVDRARAEIRRQAAVLVQSRTSRPG